LLGAPDSLGFGDASVGGLLAVVAEDRLPRLGKGANYILLIITVQYGYPHRGCAYTPKVMVVHRLSNALGGLDIRIAEFYESATVEDLASRLYNK
jgi:hypothetical protein